MRYYFHLKNGETVFDEEGLELSSIAAVREEAVRSSTELLKGSHVPNFWLGEPWMLWVTDEPHGGGNTVAAITFAARATH